MTSHPSPPLWGKAGDGVGLDANALKNPVMSLAASRGMYPEASLRTGQFFGGQGFGALRVLFSAVIWASRWLARTKFDINEPCGGCPVDLKGNRFKPVLSSARHQVA